jgi:hypothetical protein
MDDVGHAPDVPLDLLVSEAADDGQVEVDTGGPGGLGVGPKPVLGQESPDGKSDLDGFTETRRERGVEVEHDEVGVVEAVHAREPGVDFQAPPLAEPGQGRRAVGQAVVDVVVAVHDGDGPDPGRRRARDILLVEALPPDAVRVAGQVERPAR